MPAANCPKCKTGAQTVQEHAGLTCRKCGYVLPKKFIDTSSDWRDFAGDKENGGSKNHRADESGGSKLDRFNLSATGDMYTSANATRIGGGVQGADYYANIMEKVEKSVQLLANKNSLHELTNAGIRERVRRERGGGRACAAEEPVGGDDAEGSSSSSSGGSDGEDGGSSSEEEENSPTAGSGGRSGPSGSPTSGTSSASPSAATPRQRAAAAARNGGASPSHADVMSPRRAKRQKRLTSKNVSTNAALTGVNKVPKRVGAKTLILYADQLREYREQVKEFRQKCEKKEKKSATDPDSPRNAASAKELRPTDVFDKTALIAQLSPDLDAQAAEILKQGQRRKTCQVTDAKIEWGGSCGTVGVFFWIHFAPNLDVVLVRAILLDKKKGSQSAANSKQGGTGFWLEA